MYIIHTHIILSYTLVIGIEAFVLYSREGIFDILPQADPFFMGYIFFALMRGRNQSQSRSTSIVLIVLLGTDRYSRDAATACFNMFQSSSRMGDLQFSNEHVQGV